MTKSIVALVQILPIVGIGRHYRCWTLDDSFLAQLWHLLDNTVVVENDKPCAQVKYCVDDAEGPCKYDTSWLVSWHSRRFRLDSQYSHSLISKRSYNMLVPIIIKILLFINDTMTSNIIHGTIKLARFLITPAKSPRQTSKYTVAMPVPTVSLNTVLEASFVAELRRTMSSVSPRLLTAG